ncbi:RNA-binding protein MEX3B [Vespula maculifrons]|uniref:RNA-binding protein MEX3B n=1 Tax=Vespula maculifrons TaxID=7453 RepID=A0ABD2AYN8_VESMC
MPTSLFSEMDRCTNGGGAGSIEEQRALQLAFELSMLGLEGTPGCPGSGTTTVPGTNADPDPLQTAPSSVFEEARSKKSQNMTECVPVPSSEHVAEIVGRQGIIKKNRHTEGWGLNSVANLGIGPPREVEAVLNLFTGLELSESVWAAWPLVQRIDGDKEIGS